MRAQRHFIETRKKVSDAAALSQCQKVIQLPRRYELSFVYCTKPDFVKVHIAFHLHSLQTFSINFTRLYMSLVVALRCGVEDFSISFAMDVDCQQPPLVGYLVKSRNQTKSGLNYLKPFSMLLMFTGFAFLLLPH